MISDLSAGDRLSLKGKLFELQKKLTIMDMEQRLDNQFSYQPQIKSFDLPNRPRDFIQNNAKAEIIRQQKKKLLQDSIAAQTEESCTFAPKIYTSSEKFAHLDNRPVHIRLSEKAKEYRESKERRKVQYTHFDDNGRKLFSPEINRNRPSSSLNSSSILSHQSTIAPPVNTVTADEFLYQDAKDREIRHANLIQQYQTEAQQAASANKMNATSHKLLKRRTERSVSALFTVIDTNADDTFDYQDFTEFLSRSKLWDGKDHGEFLSDQQILWNCFDHYNMGTVLRRDFQLLGYCFLMHKSPKGALESFSRHEQRQRESMTPNEGQESHSLHQESRFPTMRERELHTFRKLLSLLTDFAVKELQQQHTPTVPEANTTTSRKELQQHHQHFAGSSQSMDGTASVLTASRRSMATAESLEPSFKPKIYSHSYKLAQRKERREQELVNQVVQQQQAKLMESLQQQQQQEEDMGESTRGRLRLSPSRHSSRSKIGSSIRTSKTSSSQERATKASEGENKMHISELLPTEQNEVNECDEMNNEDDHSVNALHSQGENEKEFDAHDAQESQQPSHSSHNVKEPSAQKSQVFGESTLQSLSTSTSRLTDKLLARGVLL